MTIELSSLGRCCLARSRQEGFKANQPKTHPRDLLELNVKTLSLLEENIAVDDQEFLAPVSLKQHPLKKPQRTGLKKVYIQMKTCWANEQ